MANVIVFSHHRNILELVEYFEEEDTFLFSLWETERR